MKKKSSTIQIRYALRTEFYKGVSEILRTARTKAYRAVNFTMVEAYWNVGRLIVEEEQQGKSRAKYGEGLLRELSFRLTRDFGSGFDPSNLRYMRQFYLIFPICDAARHKSLEDENFAIIVDNRVPIVNAVRSQFPEIQKTETGLTARESIRYALRSELTLSFIDPC